jgi:hypothetical protein
MEVELTEKITIFPVDRNIMSFQTNPKLEGSNIIDCIPQIGKCPINCSECYYNAEGFFTDKTKPLIPSLEEVGDKIVRVNSGHDSNIQKDLVLRATAQYKKKFYNTSLPMFDFPGPVVFTCNGRNTDLSFLCVTEGLWNVMMVRFRTNLWNLELLDDAVAYYAYERNIPVTITFMRYSKCESIPHEFRHEYELRIHVFNQYYCLKKEAQQDIVDIYKTPTNMISMCGTLESSFCKDCGRCEWAYNRFMGRINFSEAVKAACTNYSTI